MSISTITPRALAAICADRGPIDLIDVRTAVEYRALHAASARNVPLDQLDPAAVVQARKEGPSDEPLYLICHSGSRGQQACEKFLKAGYNNIVNVEGGTLAWEAFGLPLVRGKKAISLERQVRIAAGSLVCLGALLSWLVHPALVAVAAFVGAGLVYAGVTDRCGLGMLLARMPWNTCSTPISACDAGDNSLNFRMAAGPVEDAASAP